MNRLIGLRNATRILAARVGPATCISAGYILTSSPVRLDASYAPREGVRPQQQRLQVSPQLIEQVSSGSMGGFCTGVVVALLSKTLVFLGSFVAVTIYVASRYGINLPSLLGIKSLVDRPGWLRKLEKNPYFTGSFIVTFTLAAFVRL